MTPSATQRRRTRGTRPQRQPRPHRGPAGDNPVAQLLRWFRANARDLPWRQTRDPYAIWISEVMLQQTQVATVIPYFQRWLTLFPNVEALAAASPNRILKAWSGLGYYRRARNLHAAARTLARNANSRLPDTLDGWLQLPGVGRYTAGAICSIAFNHATPIVDGNVTRVLARIHALRQPPQATAIQTALWRIAGEWVETAARLRDPDHRNCSDLNQSLMELGATVCTPTQPGCGLCPVRQGCLAAATGRPERFPARQGQRRLEPRSFTVFIHQRKGRLLMHRRPRGGVNAGLWEFPTIEHPGSGPHGIAGTTVLFNLPHSITRYRIKATVVAGAPPPSLSAEAQARWLTQGAIQRLPLAGLHRKILRRLGTTSMASDVNR